jgi:hypothetical protein
MRRIFTSSVLAAVFAVASMNASGQTCSGSAFTAAETYDFSANNQGFTGDFTRVNASGGLLQSTNVSTGTTKVLTSPSFLAPNTLPNIQFGFDLAGAANVTGYTVELIYNGAGAGLQTITVCTGGALANGTYNFSTPTPAAILGQRYSIRVTFTVSGSTNQNITIDNFRVNTPASQIGLPVKFSSFEARPAAGTVSLLWNVALEENVEGYEVEKSTNGSAYSNIGTVAASGQPSYSFVDAKATEPVAYYRIKAVDVDGKLTYSAIVTVKGGKSSITLKAFPMPAINEVTIQHDAAAVESTISIASAEGRVVKSLVPAKGAQQTVVNIASLQPGVYVIRYSNGSGAAQTVKIVKQ